MQNALRLTARVQAGHRLEIKAPELPEGQDVDVFVVLPDTARLAAVAPLMDFLDSLPSGPRSAATWEQVDRQIHEERTSWDR